MDNLFWIKDNENWNKFGLRWINSLVDSLAHFVGLVLKRLGEKKRFNRITLQVCAQ